MKKVNEGNAAIGRLMRQVRELRGMSQTELARVLRTSQSAVARMEQGGQNFGTALLEKISKALGRKMMAVPSNMDYAIHGGALLAGEITINRSKNGAMGLLAASVLNHGKTILHGIPRVEETARMRELLTSLGISVRDLGTGRAGTGSFEIRVPDDLSLENIDATAAAKMRSTLMLLGGLAARRKKFTLPNAGGCIMGDRSAVAHLRGLEALGIAIKEFGAGAVRGAGIRVDASRRRAGEVVLYEMSDTATENILIAAAGIPGTSLIRFSASNYMVQDVAHFLCALGVGVSGIGTPTLAVNGLAHIDRDVEYYNSEDPTEAMFFISIAATTRSHLILRRCPIDFLQLELMRLREMGLRFKTSKRYTSDNGFTDLVDIEIFGSTSRGVRAHGGASLKAPAIKLHAQPYPGINTDNLPFFVPIATQAAGMTLIHDWMWENRAIYFTEMNRLGAKVRLADPHRVFIEGPTKLAAAQIVCPPALRPATIILVGMIAAEGTSVLRNVYSINRGYENVVGRLNELGAKIEVLL